MVKPTRNVLVIGGGVAGMSSARTLAGYGINVILVEKNEQLGGHAVDWPCMATSVCENCGACLSAELVEIISRLRHVKVYLKSEVSGVLQKNNGFSITIKGGREESCEVDAILMATGFTPFDPVGFQSIGYKEKKNVMTTVELNQIMKEDRFKELLGDLETPRIGFIQCIGSRNRELGRDYCSQVCCKISARQANKIHFLKPDAKISIFHKDFQVVGKEFRYQMEEMKKYVDFIQGVPAEIFADHKKNKLTVIGEDPENGSRIARYFDFIVLSVGIHPSTDAEEIAGKVGARQDEWGFFSKESAALPEGLYSAGAVQSPMNITSAIQQGHITARKIAHDIIDLMKPVKEDNILVFGGSSEGQYVARTIGEAGYSVSLLDSKVHDMGKDQAFEYFSSVKLKKVEGSVGDFVVKIDSNGKNKELNASALIVATGANFKPVLEDKINNLPNALTIQDFSKNIQGDLKSLPSKIVFLMDYNSADCKRHFGQVLKMTNLLADNKKNVTIIMEKMLVHGLYGQRRYDETRKKGVKFLRYQDKSQISIKETKKSSTIKIKEATLPGIQLTVEFDMLIIPEKKCPPDDNNQLSFTLKQDKDKEGLFQSPSVRHRRISSPRQGIFFAGNCHDDTDNKELLEEINAILASLAILQTKTGINDTPAFINESQCIRCLTCYRICPHIAVEIERNRQPKIAPEACFGCGLCYSNCPALAINMENSLFNDLSKEKISKTIVFACERSGKLAFEKLGKNGFPEKDVQLVAVECASTISIESLLNPLIKGTEKVIVAACHKGNCRSVSGEAHAKSRVNYIQTHLNVNQDKIDFYPVSANEPVKLQKIISNPPPMEKE